MLPALTLSSAARALRQTCTRDSRFVRHAGASRRRETVGLRLPFMPRVASAFMRKCDGTPGEETLGTYAPDPLQPIGSWKTAWKNARKAAKVACRFHDLRQSAVTRLLEGGVSFPIVVSLLGWSPSTTTKMAKRYGHIGSAAHREAVAALDPSTKSSGRGTNEGTVPEVEELAEAVTA